MAARDNSSDLSQEKAQALHISQINSRTLLPAHGGEFQPGVHAPIAQQKKLANPAPLGLGAFALTTFVLSAINLKTLDVTAPNLVVALAFGYGGLIQLLAGMWEMAVGNTFGATALSSYGGFWLSFGIVLTPAFGIVDAYTNEKTGKSDFDDVFALYLWAWFIFTSLCMLLTLRSTLAFASLFVILDFAFLFLALSKQYAASSAANGLQIAGGACGMVAAFLAWYNMFAGMCDKDNFWFAIPVSHFPWSAHKKALRSQV